MDQDSGELVQIVETRDQGLIATIKALLEGAGIEYAVNNEFSQSVFVGGGLRGVQIWVKPEDVDMAEHILRGLDDEAQPMEEAPVADQPDAASTLAEYPAPHPEQPFIVRLLWLIGLLLIPFVLVVVYSMRN